jgi:alanyl-tRNA synthetase
MTEEMCKERGVNLDTVEFNEEMKKHQELSRSGAEQKFKGGLGDTSDQSVKYHTATHLLHQALREVLGEHVMQKGSNITPERLRFDFAHTAKMTDEEKKRVEDIVNEKIQAALPVQVVSLSKEEAEKTGALHFFGEKYADTVTVYYIGDTIDVAFSKEFCGGPHVKNTSELGHFKIQKEEAVAQGVRRIKAILE